MMRKQIKAPPLITLLILFFIAHTVTILIGGYRNHWAWTGFTGDKESYKTLYDWLQLLIIPVVLAVAGFWFNHRERKAAELRAENERKAAELRAEAEREIEQQRTKAERDIAENNQREAALQAYINEMSELLLHENLRESEGNAEVRKIARARTLTVLPNLNATHKRSLLQFLHESDLLNINRKSSVIILVDADLSNANLKSINLWEADLNGANLSGADLSHSNLRNAYLIHTNLSGTNLSSTLLNNASLDEANLQGAYLIGTDLSGASLSGADLKGADLSRAILKGTVFTDAIMPDGYINY